MNIDIGKNFTYQKPSGDSVSIIEEIRKRCKGLAIFIDDFVPDSREKSIAITKIEEAMMWANAGIVRNEEIKNG